MNEKAGAAERNRTLFFPARIASARRHTRVGSFAGGTLARAVAALIHSAA